MKLLHVISSLTTGGAEKLLVDTLPLYLKNGVEVELLLLNGTMTPFFRQLENVPELIIHHLGYGSLFNPLHIFRIIPYLKKYDIIHVHLFPALYWVAIAKILSLSKTKLVYTKHSTSNRRMAFSLITKKIETWMLGRYTKIISISKEVESQLKKYLPFSQERYILIENGINVAEIQNTCPSEESFFSFKGEEQKILIQVSSFRIPKDQKTVLKAMTLLPENIKLLLAGDGPQKAECEELAQKINIQERVKFLGTRTDIPQLLKAADIVVLSTGFEGFSLAIAEGMAAGKPVLASDVPGVRDVLGDSGILFQKGDEKALSRQITNLLADYNYYNKVAMACFERAGNYDINIMVQKHLNLYKQVINA